MMKIIVTAFLAIILVSCNCGSKKEQAMEVIFSGFSEIPSFEKVEALGANRTISLAKPENPKNLDAQFLLPINSNSDSCHYFFYRPGRVDTVIVGYERRFDFRDKNCGFNLILSGGRIIKNTLSSRADVYLNLGGGFPGSFEEYSITFRN